MTRPRPEIRAEDLDLSESGGTTRLRLRVKAGGRENAVLGTHAGALKLTVTAAPEKGKANKAVRELLGDLLGVAPSSVELVAGPTSPDKTLLVPLSASALRRRLSREPGE